MGGRWSQGGVDPASRGRIAFTGPVQQLGAIENLDVSAPDADHAAILKLRRHICHCRTANPKHGGHKLLRQLHGTAGAIVRTGEQPPGQTRLDLVPRITGNRLSHEAHRHPQVQPHRRPQRWALRTDLPHRRCADTGGATRHLRDGSHRRPPRFHRAKQAECRLPTHRIAFDVGTILKGVDHRDDRFVGKIYVPDFVIRFAEHLTQRKLNRFKIWLEQCQSLARKG